MLTGQFGDAECDSGPLIYCNRMMNNMGEEELLRLYLESQTTVYGNFRQLTKLLKREVPLVSFSPACKCGWLCQAKGRGLVTGTWASLLAGSTLTFLFCLTVRSTRTPNDLSPTSSMSRSCSPPLSSTPTSWPTI